MIAGHYCWRIWCWS